MLSDPHWKGRNFFEWVHALMRVCQNHLEDLVKTDCSASFQNFWFSVSRRLSSPRTAFLTSSKGITMLLDWGPLLEGPLTWKMNSTPGLNISREAPGQITYLSQPQPLCKWDENIYSLVSLWELKNVKCVKDSAKGLAQSPPSYLAYLHE